MLKSTHISNEIHVILSPPSASCWLPEVDASYALSFPRKTSPPSQSLRKHVHVNTHHPMSATPVTLHIDQLREHLEAATSLM